MSARSPRPATADGRIVVGYDGSTHARAALLWAADEAARREARLHVVRVWHLRDAWPLVDHSDLQAVPSWAQLQQAEQRRLEADVADVLAADSGGSSGGVQGAPRWRADGVSASTARARGEGTSERRHPTPPAHC